MRIAVDMDEVLAKWGERIVQWYNEDKREEDVDWKDVNFDDINNWDIKMNLGPGSEIYVRNYMRWPGFFEGLDPVEGAIEGMRELIEMGHDVLVLTALPKSCTIGYTGKIEWLRKHMPFFDLNNVVIAKRKELVQADLLLDDGVHNLDPWHDSGRAAVAFDRPWNRNAKTPIRVQDWPQFVQFIKSSISIGEKLRDEFPQIVDYFFRRD